MAPASAPDSTPTPSIAAASPSNTSTITIDSLASDYSCPICQEVLLDPVVSPCGHAYCAHCYEALCRHARLCPSLECPMCREPLPRRTGRPYLESLKPCMVLGSAVERMLPDEVAERRQERAALLAAQAATAADLDGIDEDTPVPSASPPRPPYPGRPPLRRPWWAGFWFQITARTIITYLTYRQAATTARASVDVIHLGMTKLREVRQRRQRQQQRQEQQRLMAERLRNFWGPLHQQVAADHPRLWHSQALR